MPLDSDTDVRHDWTIEDALSLFRLPFNDLIFRAQTCHRRHFDANQVQMSRLLSVKTGGCPEDCAYCPQSAQHDTDVKAEKLMPVDDVLAAARQAREQGATRYCMGAAWRNPKDKDLDDICAMVEGVNALGLESCATLGMLTGPQAERLKQAGLDYYNHNLDTSEEYYGQIITTRTYQDRLDTLANVRHADIKVCCGGIVGLGETLNDRAAMLLNLANLTPQPESVPINLLVKVEGTPLDQAETLDSLDFVRTIAVAKIMMPGSVVRLSAGREMMSDETQALCFLAGAGSIFVGDTLLTTGNPEKDQDVLLFERLGLSPAPAEGTPGVA
ncbi:MAG: biotin synthase BioB [Alphaproteobacteria bacterium]|jgi:biotin synthase|nr:biotin synthase BioB [Alphaproteobacteria bacterium]MBT7944142.1 biotin synthase BioB [Alphaproteobacteria bacterium]